MRQVALISDIIKQARDQNFCGKKRFQQIWMQIPNNSTTLTCIRTLQRASFKNSYHCHIQIISTDIQAQAYNFMKCPETSIFSLEKKFECFSSYTIYLVCNIFCHRNLMAYFLTCSHMS